MLIKPVSTFCSEVEPLNPSTPDSCSFALILCNLFCATRMPVGADIFGFVLRFCYPICDMLGNVSIRRLSGVSGCVPKEVMICRSLV